MKLSERIKNKKKFIIGVVIGIVVVNIIGIAGVIAASVSSDVVLYDSPTGKKNVKDAIDELYTMSSTYCPDGYECCLKTYLKIVYLDPTNLSTSCNGSASSATGTKSGCMRWFVYKEDTNYYYAILDHNTSSSGSTLTTDTSSWVSSLSPRLITADEVWEITKATNGKSSWSASTATKSDTFSFGGQSCGGSNSNAWLYVNLSQGSTDGYHTSDKVTGSSYTWLVYGGALLNSSISFTYQPYFGVRPVIRISKS